MKIFTPFDIIDFITYIFKFINICVKKDNIKTKTKLTSSFFLNIIINYVYDISLEFSRHLCKIKNTIYIFYVFIFYISRTSVIFLRSHTSYHLRITKQSPPMI